MSLLTVTAGEVFGFEKSTKEDWFSNNLDLLKPLLDAKRAAAENYRLNPSSTTKSYLSKAKSDLQRNIRYVANSYWTEVCRDIQTCASTGNFSGLYSGIRKAIGPIPKKTAPLKEIDGTAITDSNRQLLRWVEHYNDLYSEPVNIEQEAIEHLPKLPTLDELDQTPSITEFRCAVTQLKCGKSPGSDSIPAEVVKLSCVAPRLYNLFVKFWAEGYVPQDMRDANIITLYKGKGDRGDCNNYRGISLLSIVGKLFGRIILTRLQKLAERIYPEAQCGFRAQRSTTDMIFTLRQLQEKCREQRTPLFVAFVDLNKAFDTVSRDGLYAVLESIGCPSKLLTLIKSFHLNMQGTVVYNGNASESFHMNRGVRQGCVLAPTLFGIFFSVLLHVAFGDSTQGIHLFTRSDGKLFKIIPLLKSKRNRKDLFIDSLLFADDAAFTASSSVELQQMIDKFAKACKLFSMSINAKKTVIMAQGTTEKPKILLDNRPLEVVESFCYLGSTVSSNLSLDAEINTRIGKAATMFGKLSARVWDNKHLSINTKMVVYQTCVLSVLLYGAETWTSYAKQERRLNGFHMRCLRSIIGISWKDRQTNERVLATTKMPSVTALLKQRRLRWLGHLHRMEPSRLPRQILLGQIAHAKRPIGRPLLRFKDSIKRDLSTFDIDLAIWEELAEDRLSWRSLTSDGVKTHDKAWFEVLARKRARRHEPIPPYPELSTPYICDICSRSCKSRIGLFSHQKKCRTLT